MNFDNLVAVLAVAAAVPLILAAVPRVRVPGPVLEIVAGIVLGPAVLDLVKPDQAVRLVSTIGLAFLLFLAGLEVDVRHFRGPRARLAGEGLGLSALLALIIGIVLYAAGVVESPLLVGIILLATSLGLITPILEDAGVADRPVGQFAIAGASLGEVTPVVLLSLFFSGRTTAIRSKLLLLSLLGVLVVLVVIGTLRIERSMWITRMINRLADTSAQIRIRLSMLLVVGLGALATHLGFEAILGAFIAGAILRLVDADAEHKHPLFHPKLDAIGYGFLIPVFFVTSGLTFNLSVLFSNASTVLRVPLFLLALLVVRGLPAVLYRSALASIRDVAAAGLLQATSLPFIVAATTIGLQLHAIRPANAAALVAAGLFSVILFPIISLQLLRSSAKGPGMVPEQAHVRRQTCPLIRAHAVGIQLSDAGSMPAERATTAHFGGHMSKPPLPEAAVAMLRKPNPAVITTLRPDGQPVSTATWYLWDNGRVLVNMDEGRKRLEYMRSDPRVALDVLDESGWYTHLSITGHVDEMQDDADLADIDRLAQQYMGRPYPQRERRRISAWIAVDGWHGWGALKDSSQPG